MTCVGRHYVVYNKLIICGETLQIEPGLEIPVFEPTLPLRGYYGDTRHPSWVASHQVGIKLYEDWGLTNHKELEDVLRSLRVKSHNAMHPLIKYGEIQTPLSDFVDDLAETLFSTNPKLHEIERRTEFDKYHVVLGCLSRFNFDDIKYFIECGESRKINRPKHELEWERFTKRNCYDTFWVLSPPTYFVLRKKLTDDFGFH